MLGVYDFCGHYEWTFEWLRQQGGELLVRQYWDQAIHRDSQRHAAELIHSKGYTGIAEYWGNTLAQEAAGYHTTATEKTSGLICTIARLKVFCSATVLLNITTTAITAWAGSARCLSKPVFWSITSTIIAASAGGKSGAPRTRRRQACPVLWQVQTMSGSRLTGSSRPQGMTLTYEPTTLMTRALCQNSSVGSAS